MLPPMSPDEGGFGYDDRPDRRRQQRKSNTSTILLVVAGILVLVGAVLIGKWVVSGSGGADKPFAAPNFVGETKTSAEQLAKNADLQLTFTSKPCEKESRGKVCDQDPDPGTNVNKGDTIKLTVSTGAPKVAVPSVLGKSLDEAKATLEGDQYQFTVKTKTQVSTEAEGTVLEQDPTLGTEVEKGSTITLTVAKAEEKSTVPDVSGKTCDEAKAQMQDNDLVGNCTEVDTNDPNQAGKVIATDPQAGTQVDKNSTVNIQIGKAPEQTQVPQIQGQKLGDAKRLLQEAGLQVGNIQGSQSDDAIVFSSDPAQGSTVNKGTAVNLVAVEQGGNGNGGNGNGGIFGGLNGNPEDD
jgi:beta-lactam-binding protein with PASTA domain